MSDKNLNNIVLIVGLGSIGQRHLRNLHHLGYEELYAVSSGKGTMPIDDLPLKGISADLETALDRFQPDVVFICNPTAMHMSSAIAAAKTGAHIFLEKPIAAKWHEVLELKKISSNNNIKIAVGFQFRQHPVLQSIRKLIGEGQLGKIHSVRMHWGEYMPAWHPWEDYRESYSAKAELGGGVTFTLCHPFDYLRWMLGEAETVMATIKNTGELGIEVDDVHLSTWQFHNGVSASVYLDYLERPPSHELTIVASEGKVEWSNESGNAFLFTNGNASDKICLDDNFERNDLFVSEVREFMESISTGKEVFCKLDDGIANLKMILASKAASDLHKKIVLKEFDPTNT